MELPHQGKFCDLTLQVGDQNLAVHANIFSLHAGNKIKEALVTPEVSTEVAQD